MAEITEHQVKHLEFIQSIITRMNSNSFQIKGWSITIVSALLALYTNSSIVTYIFISLVPTFLFWFLDAYYLQQERKFRGLYKGVIKGDISSFEIPLDKYKGGGYKYCCAFWSKTIARFYGSICVFLFLLGLILEYKDCITFNC